MPSVNLDNVIQVRAHATLAGQRLITIHNYAVVDGINADYDDLITALHVKLTDPILGWLTQYVNAVSDEWQGVWVDYQKVKPTREYYIRKAWAPTGGIASPSLPPGATAAITKQGSIAGKGLTGHMLYSGVPAIHNNNGLLTEAYRTGEADSLADTLAGEHFVETMDLKPIIGTAKVGGQWNEMLNGLVEREVRTMKRRVVGRGI